MSTAYRCCAKSEKTFIAAMVNDGQKARPVVRDSDGGARAASDFLEKQSSRPYDAEK